MTKHCRFARSASIVSCEYRCPLHEFSDLRSLLVYSGVRKVSQARILCFHHPCPVMQLQLLYSSLILHSGRRRKSSVGVGKAVRTHWHLQVLQVSELQMDSIMQGVAY